MSDLVHPKESQYFTLAMIISILIYMLLVVSLVGIFYLIFGAIFFLFSQGVFVGTIKGNGVRLSENQFPEVYGIAKKLAAKLELSTMPEIYIVQAGGLLNAYATRFLSKEYVVIYSDVFELAYEKGEAALSFVIGHELAHLKCNHVKKQKYILPAMFVPFIGAAYSRACEYTSDRFGASVCPEGASDGLLVLAAGKKLYGQVNQMEYLGQINNESDFWVWLAEALANHPNLPKRIRALNIQ